MSLKIEFLDASYVFISSVESAPVDGSTIKDVYVKLVANGTDADAGSLIDATRQVLLGVVQERVGRNATLGAAIMGITPPTYKRWVVAQHEV